MALSEWRHLKYSVSPSQISSPWVNMSEMSSLSVRSHCTSSTCCAVTAWPTRHCKLYTDPSCLPEFPTRPVSGGASRRQIIDIASKHIHVSFFSLSVVESGPVYTRLTGQRQLNSSRTTTSHCSVASWTPSSMCCINFSLPTVIITTISGRDHTIFPSFMSWTTVTSYLG